MEPGERARSIDLLHHPDRWPYAVVLPVKRFGENQTRTAIIRLTPSGLHLIDGGNLYITESWADKRGVLMTAEEIVDQGWLVD